MIKLKIFQKKKILVFSIFLLILFFLFEFKKYEISKNFEKIYSSLEKFKENPNSVIIFAPHCDDEILCCGGIIQSLISKGKEVKIVVITNGDGFKYAAEVEFKKFSLKPEDYIKFAYERQKETIAGMELLGVKKENIIFLGYPDKGLLPMWSKYFNCDKLYTSPFTKDNFSPYYNSFKKSAPYCGISLLSDIEEIILKFNPEEIYIPHPNDDHSDHQATYCFVKTALKKLKKEDIKIYTYLIHRGLWPQPQGFNPEIILLPPLSLLNSDTFWNKFNLSEKMVELKYQAFLKYESQIKIMKKFLSSFIRKNEIFGILKDVEVEEVKFLKIDGNPSDWEKINSKILDPKNDNLFKKGSMDIESVYFAKDKENIYIMLKTSKKISSLLDLKFNFHIIGREEPNFQIILKGRNVITNLPDLKEKISFSKKEVLEIKIPRNILSTQFFLQIEAYFKFFKIDRTPWRLLIL
jgi:LmbE family N-acetylglucosaminyl deacetylase